MPVLVLDREIARNAAMDTVMTVPRPGSLVIPTNVTVVGVTEADLPHVLGLIVVIDSKCDSACLIGVEWGSIRTNFYKHFAKKFQEIADV